ncbi:hypothetical protein TUM19329_15790 [Legionella antarctica]|uniref:Uncharacterized protein n=1 Tax=Legionella antarctica TaxID=2708020 RepID=A0A6F8T487_9GAMM|nr:hypothetical protein [Legionella antarctica]BCA95218.1 hypothetical protein TUM19329_15790 [Legionella antarctica]
MIFNLSLLIKHCDYQIEDEVRLLLFDRNDGEYQFHKERLGYRTGKDSKYYIDQDIEIKRVKTDRTMQYLVSGQFQHNDIKEIWFGNKLDDTTISKFKEHLSNQGYDIKKIKFEQFVSSYR